MANSSVKFLPPRNSMMWLVVALSSSFLPIAAELPVWLAAIWLCVVYWRIQVFRGNWQLPATLSKVVLVVVCSTGLLLSFGRFLGLEPMVSLLVCALILKLLEMRSRRDALLLLYLSYFVIATQFLFSQSLVALVIGIGCIWLVTTALLVIHQPQGHEFPKRSLKLGGRLLLHALPLMLVLFLIMPRIGSLWSIPLQRHGGVTGVSDSMSPGDFSRLSKSGGVAFRVSFKERPPEAAEFYWRGLVFTEFDGRRWTPPESSMSGDKGETWIKWGETQRSDDAGRRLDSQRQALGRTTSYDIILEPTQQQWLYSLMLPTGFQSSSDYKLIQTSNQRLVSDKPVRQRMDYSVTSSLAYRIAPDFLSSAVRAANLNLPSGFNPTSVATAQKWRRETGSDRAYIQKLLQYFNASFVYTLEPPALGRDTVDEFMWGTQQGFCEHYASSFVVMMRAAGIPARVVAGYLGAEYNELEDYYVVHQYDAHAWTEVWLDGEGWVRIDPTAAVAPERVRDSLGNLQSDMVQGVWSLGRYRDFALLNQLRMQWDALNYRWHRTVMGFDGQRQSQLLNDWLNGVTPMKLVVVVLGTGAVILGLMTLQLWWRGRPQPMTPARKALLRVEKLLQRRGYVRRDSEPVGAFFDRVASENPSVNRCLGEINQLFDRAIYGSGNFDKAPLVPLFAELKSQLPRKRVKMNSV